MNERKLKTAIYHSTNVSLNRPMIYINQIKTLEEYATSKGFEVTDIFCDKSLKRCEQTEFKRFMAKSDCYDILVTKDFYHLCKNTGKCISIMKELIENGLQIFSLENGIFTLEDGPLDKPLRVVTYTCHYGEANEMKEVIAVRNDIMNLFAKKKTNWTVVDQFYDDTFLQKDSEQIQMKKLINNRKKYDLLLVHNMNDIHWRTAKFCKLREQLQLDIFSLQQGFFRYGRST